MPDVAVTVIGGGIVGCAVAARTAKAGLATVLLERGPRLGGGITSRNSEVVHGGMYYQPGSLKARFCVPGRRLLKDFCAEHGVRYRECGKLIAAADQTEIEGLQHLLSQGEANGVEDLRLVDARETASMEPAIRAVAALWSPRTAIVDSEGAVRAFAGLARDAGAHLLTAAECVGLVPERGGWRLEVQPAAGGGRESWRHTSRWVVNAAGLFSDRLAALAGIDIEQRGWRLRWVKGNYFAVSPRHDGRVGRLVYPVPPGDRASLGVHLCLDLAGRMRLGPDVEPLPPHAEEDYNVDPARLEAIFRGAVRFLPFLRREDLTPDTCGLRPRLASWWRDGWSDFVCAQETGDLTGLINLVGIESPGLTSAPAIAAEIVEWILR